MRPTRRSGMGNLLSMLALAVSFAAAANPASAQYPTKPIRIIVPFAAGGTTDILSRAVGAKLAAVLGQPVIADNRPGASGVIGSEIVARLGQEIARILKDPELRELMLVQGAELVGNSPEEFGQFVRAEMDKWGALARRINLRVD
ncbi:MAG: hypothetical protein E6H41_04295 [Betaproteobacteria bacterium]|nr:MAG: hypothetical protein E6H41_04295 [Betaproteobacteria bacterium]